MQTSEFIKNLVLADGPAKFKARSLEEPEVPSSIPGPLSQAVINGGSLISFVAGVPESERRDILYSVQLAQRGATGAFNKFEQTQKWYDKYSEILGQIGWVCEQFAFTKYDQSSGHIEMDKAALEVISAIATGGQLAILTKSLDALRSLSDGDKPITLLEYNALAQASGNFQIGAVQKAEGGALSMALGGFYFHAGKSEHRFLFFSWGGKETKFWSAALKLTFNVDFYSKHREVVEEKLGVQASDYLAGLALAP